MGSVLVAEVFGIHYLLVVFIIVNNLYMCIHFHINVLSPYRSYYHIHNIITESNFTSIVITKLKVSKLHQNLKDHNKNLELLFKLIFLTRDLSLLKHLFPLHQYIIAYQVNCILCLLNPTVINK